MENRLEELDHGLEMDRTVARSRVCTLMNEQARRTSIRCLERPSGGEFAGQRALVTGASGFLGTHLCHLLSASGAEVHATSRSPRTGSGRPARWWECDLQDANATRALLAAVKPDVVFHLAGLTKAAPDLSLVLPTFHSILTSTVNLLVAATERGCRRLVLIGSLEEPQAVGSRVAPSSPYGAAKWAAAAYGLMFHRLYRTPVTIIRLFMTYGPAQALTKVVPYTISELLSGRSPRLSSGRQERDWIYIDDVITGLLCAGARDGVEGATIDLGTGTAVSLRSVVKTLVELIDPSIAPDFSAVPDRPHDPAHVADTDATYHLMGWRPVTSIGAGLARTVDWYRHNLETFRAADLPSLYHSLNMVGQERGARGARS